MLASKAATYSESLFKPRSGLATAMTRIVPGVEPGNDGVPAGRFGERAVDENHRWQRLLRRRGCGLCRDACARVECDKQHEKMEDRSERGSRLPWVMMVFMDGSSRWFGLLFFRL